MRSTRQIGGFQALQLMLTGRMLRAHQARSIGLVDQLVGPHAELRWAARRAVLNARKSRGAGFIAKLSNRTPVRKYLAGQMRKRTAAKASPQNYPAPFELIDAWEAHGNKPKEMLAEEVTRNARLITGSTSRGLRRVFWLMKQLKAQGKNSDFKARRVHVIGQHEGNQREQDREAVGTRHGEIPSEGR